VLTRAAQRLASSETWISAPITDARAGQVFDLFKVPAGVLVSKVLLVVVRPFDQGRPGIAVGDGQDDDGWLHAGAVAHVTGAYDGRSKTAPWSALGKYYAEQDRISASATSDLSGGCLYVVAFMDDLNEVLR
jgi:hypothetical protein